jgi:uncharacterized protein (TIGR02300 family)
MTNLGTKHECYSCGTKFYDFGKPQALCPKCGANQADGKVAQPSLESAAKKRRREAASRRAHQEEEEVVAPVEEAVLDDAEDLTAELGEAEEETLDEDE